MLDRHLRHLRTHPVQPSQHPQTAHPKHANDLVHGWPWLGPG